MHCNTVRLVVQVWLVVSLLGCVIGGVSGSAAADWWVGEAVGLGGLRGCGWRTAWRGLGAGWRVALVRSLCIWGLWQLSGQVGWGWWALLPWLMWLLPAEGEGWGALRGGLWQVQRVVVLGYVGLNGVLLAERLGGLGVEGLGLGLGCVVCGREEPYVGVERQADGSYAATLCGHFRLRVGGDAPFRMRLLLIVLGLLETADGRRGSRRTRDGRTPFVRQEQLASWFGVVQEVVSRYNGYWLAGEWANLLSLHSQEVLTAEWVARVAEVAGTFPDWSSEQVYQHLRRQGVPLSRGQVEQALVQSGWQALQTTLRERYQLGAAGLPVREGWLIQQLLQQVERLLECVEHGLPLTREEQWSLADVHRLAGAVSDRCAPPLAVRPWLQQLEAVVFGQWTTVADGRVRCPSCGSSEVGRKSRRARQKKYYDAAGQVQSVAVYRYYCRNADCRRLSFTHLPAGLLPFSPYRAQLHLLALQMYAWGYSTYRRSGAALGVGSLTVYRWVSAWGHDLLPIAALFGVVRSSGVVGVDEKYVLVPKNDKPAAAMRRWMYVYLAVDVWTYDLLHIAIYPGNDSLSAHAFLLALRAKGYHPQVIVTDLRQDYGALIGQVFPHAEHHACIFHALQNVQQHVKAVYGPDYARHHPEAEQLKQRIYHIFDTPSATDATQRYRDVLALRHQHVATTPQAATIFDFLERHWPTLVNAIGNDRIPTTNNAVEMVIRRFDQHYQNFCGFESLASAQCYLAVFEKLYRLTPFSQDAQPRIRGKSPLQLAGYDVSSLPMSAICSGLSIDWPVEVNVVPNL